MQHAAGAGQSVDTERHARPRSRSRFPSTLRPTGRPGSTSKTARGGRHPEREAIDIEVCDQYTIQGDLFSEAIRRGAAAPYPLEDSIANLRVIDALFKSADTNAWQTIA